MKFLILHQNDKYVVEAPNKEVAVLGESGMPHAGNFTFTRMAEDCWEVETCGHVVCMVIDLYGCGL